jgi:hypothetical protein
MNSRIKKLVSLSSFFMLLLSGCASLPNTGLDTSNQQKIQSITILPVVAPGHISVENMGIAGGFGLVGGLIQESINKSHADDYSTHVADSKINFATIIKDRTSEVLSAGGYKVSSSPAEQGSEINYKELDAIPSAGGMGRYADPVDYTKIQTNADATLSIWFTSIGYVSLVQTIHFTPLVGVRVRLVDARTKQELYFKTFSCGWDVQRGTVYVPADKKYSYLTFDELGNRDFDQSIEGLENCEDKIASLIGQDLSAGRTSNK